MKLPSSPWLQIRRIPNRERLPSPADAHDEVGQEAEPPGHAGEYEVAGDPSDDARPALAAVVPGQPAQVLPYLPVDEGVVDARLYFPDKVVDLYAPVVLLGLGAAVGLWELAYLYGDVREAARFAIRVAGSNHRSRREDFDVLVRSGVESASGLRPD